MTDVFDRAQEAQNRDNRQALERHQARVGAKNSFQYPLQINCLDCSTEIPEARRQAVPGCSRCITCQMAHEQGRELYEEEG